jgi:D-amino-acid dehydrogenase
MEFSGFNTDLNRRRLNALMTAAQTYMKTPPQGPVEEEWAALRPMSPDDLPVIDRAPGNQNIFVATGHGMLGLTAATATGKLLAEMICNQPSHIDPAPFRMNRF